MEEATDQAKYLLELAKDKSLIDVVLRHWLGRWPEKRESKLLEEMMILAVDHRAEAPSAKATIASALGGQGLVRSVEAGVSEINESHGGAIEGCGKILQENVDKPAEKIVSEAMNKGIRIPGFGHRVYKVSDPRAVYLLQRTKDAGLFGKYANKAVEIEFELEKQKGHKLVMNIDGAMAVVLCEMNIKPELMNGFFLWPRVAGLVYRWNEAVSAS